MFFPARSRLLAIAAALAFLVLPLSSVHAEEDADAEIWMDDVLAGFDDDENKGETDEDVSMDDILGGFDDDDDFGSGDDIRDEDDSTPEDEDPIDRMWDLQGNLNFGLSLGIHDHESATGTDYSGLQRFRTKLALQLDIDQPCDWNFRVSGYGFYDLAYVMNGRHDYTKEVLDTYEYDFELTDTYLEGSLHKNVDIKLGRQVVNWGRSESIRVLDIINPLDSREPGLVDIEDIKRSLGMVKLGFFRGPWTLTVLAIPEVRPSILPAYGSDLSPDLADSVPFDVEALAADCMPFGMTECDDPETQAAYIAARIEAGEFVASLSEENAATAQALFAIPTDDLLEIDTHVGDDFGRATEFAMNLTGVFSGWDVSFQAARYNDENMYFNLERRRLEQSRLWMVGSGANYTVGSWLFKAEIAYVDGLEYLWADDEKSRIDAMMGVEYYGINDVNIVFEIAERHIFDFEKSMELLLDFAQEDSIESALRITANFLNDQVHVTLLGFAIGEKAQDGSFIRISGEYDVIDALSVEAGFLLFQSGDNVFFNGAGKNDRFFAGAKYSF